jgi:hypothetical protein
VPISRAEACGVRCEPASDGCGVTYFCGAGDCPSGACDAETDRCVSACECPAGYCGKLATCSGFVWCGGCGNDVCSAQQDGTKACELAISGEHQCSPVQGPTCCEQYESRGCYRAFYGSLCDPGETLSPVDGSQCGTCTYNGTQHYCHAP